MTLIKERICAYGGTFDIPTIGHLRMIQKACALFDKVLVVVSANPEKTPIFSESERLSMLTQMIQAISKPTRNNISVSVLPSHDYLANYAYKNGARYLVRGIRDNIDFPYEQKINRTNKKICSLVETVYLMPEDDYSLVSSSWVKGLVGINGWRELIEDAVPDCVLDALKERYVYNELVKLSKEKPFDMIRISDVWEAMQAYKNNAYHNFDHIIDGLEAFKNYGHLVKVTPEMIFAWLLHDIDQSEDKSSVMAQKFIARSSLDIVNEERDSVREKVKKFIEATTHRDSSKFKMLTNGPLPLNYSPEEYEMSFFTSVDLLCLGLEGEKYDDYTKKVFSEYSKKSGLPYAEFTSKWDEGRKDFLSSMLNEEKRACIYPCPEFRFYFEYQARKNMQKELDILNGEYDDEDK